MERFPIVRLFSAICSKEQAGEVALVSAVGDLILVPSFATSDSLICEDSRL